MTFCVKLLSGDIIECPIECPMSSSLKTIGCLSTYLETINAEFKDSELIFFNNNSEKLDVSTELICGEMYYLVVNDFVVNVSFDKTIHIKHMKHNKDNKKLPKKGVLEINLEHLEHKAYEYIYNEIRYSTDDDKWDDLLIRYNLYEIYDFHNLKEEVKITLIIAYLRECLRSSMMVTGYHFIGI